MSLLPYQLSYVTDMFHFTLYSSVGYPIRIRLASCNDVLIHLGQAIFSTNCSNSITVDRKTIKQGSHYWYHNRYWTLLMSIGIGGIDTNDGFESEY